MRRFFSDQVNGVVLPEAKKITHQEIERLIDFITEAKHLVVLTGAGLSTESGLPDYRSPQGSYSRGHKPITWSEFIGNEFARQRYWARNMQGFPRFSQTKPNDGHKGIATFEKLGFIKDIITQNVDQLHQRAGSQNVIELHGNSFNILCSQCKDASTRQKFQERLEHENPSWLYYKKSSSSDMSLRPDFDIDLGEVNYKDFKVPPCEKCGGILRPTFVFMGENVAKDKVQGIFDLIEQKCDRLLAVGSSLQVYSAFRFVRAANLKKIPIGVINIGPTRADDFIDFKIEGRIGDVLPLAAKMKNIQI